MVAHDLKNLLSVVLGHAELQSVHLEESGGDAGLLESLKTIHLYAGRATSVCEDLLALAAGQEGTYQEFSLSSLAATTAELFHNRSGCDLEVMPSEADEVVVIGSRNAIGRAVLNLVWNALDAVADQTEGWIGLRWGDSDGTPWLEVLDNGPGLPDGELGDFTDAFRSTREGAAPRGLGLTLASLVMQEQGGELKGRNRQNGSGAVMRLEFRNASRTA